MLRSLFSGVSGMKSQQTKMDVIGNNIANATTTAFKSSRVNFKDMLSQTMQSASSPTTTVGGINPKQAGLGVSIASIDTDMSQGALQPTERASDLAIQGNGFFIVSNGADKYYTRDGSFTLDKNGDLLTSEGLHVVGTNKQDVNAKYVNIPLEHSVVDPIPISTAAAPITEECKIKLYGFDGNGITSIVVNKNTPASTGKVKTVETEPLYISYDSTTSTLTINSNGITNISDLEKMINKNLSMIQKLTDDELAAPDTDTTPNIKNLKKLLDLGITGVSLTGSLPSDLSKSATIVPKTVKITSYAIEKNGDIRAIYGDDVFNVGSIKTATFQNPGGLEKKGSNLYMATANSGQALEGSPADTGYGTIEQGYLEMSKVDLANEFTDMIITSRAFQANSRTITTSDEMLQELLNLKR